MALLPLKHFLLKLAGTVCELLSGSGVQVEAGQGEEEKGAPQFTLPRPGMAGWRVGVLCLKDICGLTCPFHAFSTE